MAILARGQSDRPKAFAEVIPPDAITEQGVLTAYQVAGRLYFGIPQNLLEQPLLWLARVAFASDMVGYGNESLARLIIDWRMQDGKMFLRSLSRASVAEPSDPIANAVATTSYSLLIKSFPVLARASNGELLVDVTALFSTDIPELGMRDTLKAQGVDTSASFIRQVRAFPSNIEVEAEYSFTGVAALPAETSIIVPRSNRASIIIHHSIMKLPSKVMQPRVADPRVGTIAVERLNFSLRTTRPPVQKLVARWRLEKKDPLANVSDAVHPIEIYVDPATPTQWVPYVKMGIEDWKPALQEAGFRDAIVAREVAGTDKNWNPADARFTVVKWQALTSPSAFSGPVTDPRSGEILLAQIQVFQGIIDRMAGNYFVQAGPLDPRARKWPFPDELVGTLVRYVVAHEVGHALGLNHNLVASAMYPAEKMRDRTWVRRMGYTPSIMDYSRFNYVAQPEDEFSAEDLVPRVGPYDLWAIHWMYAPIVSTGGVDDEKPTLDAWAREQEGTPWLRWVTENGNDADPTDRAEAIGDSDPILSSTLGLKNLQRVMDNIVQATAGENWRDLENLYKRVLGQWTNEMVTVATWVGGETGQEKAKVSDGSRFTIVPKDRQKSAVKFLNEHAFVTPKFLIRSDVVRRIEPAGISDHICEAQKWVLRKLLTGSRLSRMEEQVAIDRSAAYSPEEFLSDVRKGIWKEVYGSKAVDLWRRNLQGAYLEIISDAMYSPGSSAVRFLLRGELEELDAIVTRALTGTSLDRSSRAYLREIRYRVNRILDPKQPIVPAQQANEPSYFPLR